MIEQLKNCPNCGGILNDAGTCVYCGSKVYDMMAIDFTGENKRGGAKSYIRLKINTDKGPKIVIAPISVNTVSLTSTPTYCDVYVPLHDRFEAQQISCDTRLTIECRVIDNEYVMLDAEKEANNE